MSGLGGAVGGGGGWHVGRAEGKCAACGVEIGAGVACWAALCDRGVVEKTEDRSQKSEGGSQKGAKGEAVAEVSPFVRVDFCEGCWGAGKRPGDVIVDGVRPGEMFSFWKTVVPVPAAKKKLLVDDSVLVDVFGRMEGRNEPQEVRFRFVLALILMRKRLLRYEGMVEAVEGKEERWKMIPRGTGGEGPGAPVEVVNPHLTEEQIGEVSQQLSAILAEEV